MEQKTLVFKEDRLILLDQRKLPAEIKYFTAENYKDVEFAISNMVVRGAPAIGATGAYGVYLAALEFKGLSKEKFITKLKQANKKLAKARPTAVNLSWAIKQMEILIDEYRGEKKEEIIIKLYKEAERIKNEDIKTNKRMAVNGNQIIPEEATILTHCNAGALATVDYGTALGVIREAFSSGKNIKVYADETRPRLQGARLTAFELVSEGIEATLIADSVAPTLIRDGVIDIIIVGADRIAANGDTANKIGTYMLSEIAAKFDVPFYIAAPISTIDFDINTGDEIEIEERSPREVTHIEGKQIAPEEIEVYNPAFDVTPAANITGIITEEKILYPPFAEQIKKLYNA